MLDTSIPLSVQNLKFPDLLEIMRARTQNQNAKLQNQALAQQNANLQTQGKMGDLALLSAQRDNKKALEDESKADTFKGLLQVNTETGPDGSPTVNHSQMVRDLIRLGRPQDAMDYQKKVQADKLAQIQAKRAEYQERLGLRERILADHNPENYASKLSILKSFGDDLEDLPQQYDKTAVDNSLKQVLTLKDRIAQSNKENEDRAKQDNDKAMRTQAAATLAETSRHNKAMEAIEGRKTAVDEKKNDPGLVQVPGLKPIPGVKITPDSVKKVKDAAQAYDEVNKLIGDISTMYKKHGTELIGDAARQMQSKVRQLQLTLKGPEFINLGVLNGPDLGLLEQMVPDPTSVSSNVKSMIPGIGDPVKPQLAELKNFVDNRYLSAVKRNGFDVDETAPGNTGATVPPGDPGAAHYDYVPGKGLVPVGGQ